MNWKRLTLLPALALSLAIWGCEQGGLMGPEVSGPLYEGVASEGDYVIVKESQIVSGTVTKVIGSDGGEIEFGEHHLKVPAGAVSAATTFSITKAATSDLRLTFTATQLTTNDVGSAGFAKPLTLKLHYGKGSNLPDDVTQLVGVWVKSDGTMEAQSSSVDAHGRNVLVTLNHFSDYALAYP